MKKRYWAFVLYLDSAPTNWKELIQERGIPFCISPYHDKDLNPTGEPKKPHYHIILCFNGPTTYNNVKSITDSLNQPIPIPLDSVRGYYRYLTHKDNPDKYQYNEKDIECFNGFYVSDFVDLTEVEIMELKRSIFHLIETLNIKEYGDLIDYLNKNEELSSQFQVACKNTTLFNTYISSKRNKEKDIEKLKDSLRRS